MRSIASSTSRAATRSPGPVSRIANSSPPRRATKPLSWNRSLSRRLTATSSSSPVECPNVSLIALKPSRSRSATANGPPWARVRRSISASKARRLPSPVSTSVSASLRASERSMRALRSADFRALFFEFDVDPRIDQSREGDVLGLVDLERDEQQGDEGHAHRDVGQRPRSRSGRSRGARRGRTAEPWPRSASG